MDSVRIGFKEATAILLVIKIALNTVIPTIMGYHSTSRRVERGGRVCFRAIMPIVVIET